jgi:prevent-host-death family protein
MAVMLAEVTISATEFKAKCLELLDRLAERKLTRIEVTKRGRVVAVLTPPEEAGGFDQLYGFMEGSVVVPEGFDLTAPVIDEPLNAEQGRLYEE